MNAADIRDLYRDFFVERGHLAGEPASLVPAGDTSVLFTTAGMQQYKPYFLGVQTPPATRITTCQRSFRTSDVENVGKTARHLTFFEMLGNFSFGDYFKAEAIQWALELSDQLGIPRDKVWVSVFGGDAQVPADEEAVEMWKSHGFGDDRIVRLGRSDNFWGPAGPTGPCGPCSELYYDFGPEMGCDDPGCKPGCDCDRYLEYWNLVFVQYDMDETGNLTPLPKGSIDTGMGLERIASISQGVTNVFETDLFKPLVERGAELAGVEPSASPAVTRALRTMAEHARGASFLIMDGVLPGNDGRDYVLRRIIRRAVQQAVAIGVERPFLSALTDAVVDHMGGAYPALVEAQPEIRRVVEEEEVRFRRTLDQGMGIIEEALRRARDAGTELPAEVAFELHDTYGFPFDLTREIAAEQDMTVDEERFGHLMEEQRERARAAQKEGAFASGPGEVEDFQRRYAETASEFVGYERLEVFTVVRSIGELSDGRVAVKLAESPFYAEGGGQIADTGWIHTDSGKLEVENVVKFVDDQVDRGAPGRGQGRPGRARQGHGQRRAPPPDGLQPHGDAPAAQRPAHRARRARPAGRLHGASRAPALRLRGARGAHRRSSCARSRTSSTGASSRTTPCARSSPPASTRPRSALGHSSRRSTASSCACSRSTTSAASSAAAPTSRPPRRSASSRSRPASLSAPTRAASRPSRRPRPSSTTAASSTSGTPWRRTSRSGPTG